MPSLAAQSGVQALIYFYAISFQSVNGKAYHAYRQVNRQYGCYRIILNEQTEDPVLKPPQSLYLKCSYGCQKKIIDCGHNQYYRYQRVLPQSIRFFCCCCCSCPIDNLFKKIPVSSMVMYRETVIFRKQFFDKRGARLIFWELAENSLNRPII